ncbi:hypothetical protein GCM10011393_40540 [Sphingopyxis bauzanensis]|nr:hypothetical protein GCM10011393_40540 [Sphingopyxis bauzanensis]
MTRRAWYSERRNYSDIRYRYTSMRCSGRGDLSPRRPLPGEGLRHRRRYYVEQEHRKSAR